MTFARTTGNGIMFPRSAMTDNTITTWGSRGIRTKDWVDYLQAWCCLSLHWASAGTYLRERTREKILLLTFFFTTYFRSQVNIWKTSRVTGRNRVVKINPAYYIQPRIHLALLRTGVHWTNMLYLHAFERLCPLIFPGNRLKSLRLRIGLCTQKKSTNASYQNKCHTYSQCVRTKYMNANEVMTARRTFTRRTTRLMVSLCSLAKSLHWIPTLNRCKQN